MMTCKELPFNCLIMRYFPQIDVERPDGDDKRCAAECKCIKHARQIVTAHGRRVLYC